MSERYLDNKENIQALIQLISDYRTITLEYLEELNLRMDIADIPSFITGFGRTDKCSICATVDSSMLNMCSICFWGYLRCMVHHTYSDIESAITSKELLKAFHARADYIESELTKYKLI